MPDEILDVTEAAARLQVSPQRVRDYCRDGFLPGAANTNKLNPHRGEWEIPAGAMEACREKLREKSAGKRGPKPKALKG